MLKRLFLVLVTTTAAHAMVFDNRFLPLYLKPFTRRPDAPYHVSIQPFFMMADRAFADARKLNIPDIYGGYDSICVANALVGLGFENPLRSDFRSRTSLLWNRKGRLDAQGLAFLFEFPVNCYVSLGFDTLFAHVSARQEFFLEGADAQLPAGDREYLMSVREKMHKELGIAPGLFSHTGMGDIDAYIRFGSRWDYVLKCRRVEAGLKFGVIVPSAQRRALNNPMSIPLGGEKHWGAYVSLENEIELKEDLIVGFMARASKRFERTQTSRMPLSCEPFNYGAICGPLSVNPGWTFVFNPYLSVEGLREGLGLKAQYTLVSHLEDRLSDARSLIERERIPSNLNAAQALSSWGMESVTIGAFYDFGLVKESPCLYPKISVYWDIPVDWLVAKRSAKTNCVSLMLELDF